MKLEKRRKETLDLSVRDNKKEKVTIAMTTDLFLWFYSIMPVRQQQITQGTVQALKPDFLLT